MSVDRDGSDDDRDLAAELESPAAGFEGLPVDAVCTGCGRTRVKRASPDEADYNADADPATIEASDLTSFKHVCYPCQGATWWNPIAVLSGLLEADAGDGDDA